MSPLLWVLLIAGLGAVLLTRRIRSGRRITAFRARGAVVVDVRTPGEFRQGHAPGAINLPLDQLGHQARKLDTARLILVCCASGARSAVAARMLREKGFDTFNAGSWTRLR